MSIPLSVIAIAKNEEKRIDECLQSVYGWVDEIVVVDDQSTDRTFELAKKYTDKVFTRKMDLEGRQRNFGVDKARNAWVMMLDCDERVTPELKEEIIATINKNEADVSAYWIRQICYLGKAELKYGGWASEHLRIYHKDRLRWKEDPYDLVHPGFIDDKTKHRGVILNHKLIHYNFADIEDFIRKVNSYTTKEAMKWHISGRKMSFGRAVLRMFDRFFRRYVRRQGYKDGFYGFIAALISGFYEMLAYAKFREVREFGFYKEKFLTNDIEIPD